MFVYLLIAAELTVLYTVFWYLFLRDSKAGHRIKGSTWGSYEGAFLDECADPTLPLAHACACTPEMPYHVHDSAKEQRQEFVLDKVTNHYVPINESGSVLVRMANSIDRTFSQLNVRP